MTGPWQIHKSSHKRIDPGSLAGAASCAGTDRADAKRRRPIERFTHAILSGLNHWYALI
jgi:hypothetical protein